MVGDGDPVRVASKVIQHVFRSAEWWLGVDDPVLPKQLPEKGRKYPRLVGGLSTAMQLQLLSAQQILESFGRTFPGILC